MIQINKANIPADLIERKQWVLWKIVKRDGNDTKVPYQLNGAGAKSNDPSTWSDFESIYRRYLVGGWHGIGFVFSADDPYVGVDLDGCRNPDTNEVVPWAKKLVLDLASYAEVSPSGTGVKLWVRGQWPYAGGHKVILDDVEKITDKTPAIEVYESVRYFAVTGRVLAGQKTIADRQEQLDAIRKQFWKEEPSAAQVPHGEWRSEASVIDRARKYLAKMDTAVSGQDGHGTTFKAACALVLGFDLSTGDALGLLHEWNQGCQPPWSDRDLKHKVDDAARQNGERGYLRNVAPQNYERVPMPEYRQKPQNEPQQQDEPKDDVQVTLLDDAARAYLKTVTDGGAKLLSLGLPNLDAAIGGGVEPGEMIIFAARPSHGKSQPLSSKVLTPSGYIEMGDVRVGQKVIGSNGRETTVIAIHPQGVLDVVRVTFTDGQSCECSMDHLWFTQTRNERRRGIVGSVKATHEIKKTVTRRDSGSPNHAVPLVGAVEFAEASQLRIPAYTMGLLLGDGSFRPDNILFCKPEPDLHEAIRAELPETDIAQDASPGVIRIRRKVRNNTICETAKHLEYYGLTGCTSLQKFIPKDYLSASVGERLNLLRGLLDTDGHVVKEGTTVEFATSSPQLAEDVAYLARSLGAYVRENSRVPVFTRTDGCKADGATSYRLFIGFQDGTVPVASKKHLARWKQSTRFHRSIESVEFIGRKECQCITVAADDGLYVTDGFIVTHNSMAAQQVVYNFISLGIPAMIVSEEMSHLMLGKRAIQFATEAPSEHWAARAESVSRDIDAHFAGSANCFILEGCRNVNRVVEQIRRFVAEQGVGLAVVDYAQLLAGNGKGRYDQITQVSIELKKVAAECKIPVIVLCQMSRSIEGRDSYLPRMSDLKESGQFEQDADVIVFQAWPYKLDPDKHPPEEYWLFVGKNRNRGIHSHMVKCKFLPGRQKLVYDTPVKPEADDFDPVNMDWDQIQSGTGF